MPDDELKLNPIGGGPPRNPEKEVVGRDAFVESLISHLGHSSVAMYAPRRLGKSWVLHYLTVKSPEGVKAIYFDLEGIQTLYELVVKTAKNESLHLLRIRAELGKILEDLRGYVKSESYEFPWRDHFNRIFKSINDQNVPVWFLWDEFPIYINNLSNSKGPDVATAFLDYFRSVRQTFTNLRFVLTGSIGLHWVIEDLEKTGWRNPPNDLTSINLKTLKINDATLLAKALLRGMDKEIGKEEELAIAVSGHPFYIQKTIIHLDDIKPEESISDFCDRLAQRVEDHFGFNDLLKRIGHYFGRERGLATRIIDLLAEESSGSIKDIADKLNQSPEDILSVLQKLEMDGYVEKNGEQYQICFPIFRRWWIAKRGGMYEKGK